MSYQEQVYQALLAGETPPKWTDRYNGFILPETPPGVKRDTLSSPAYFAAQFAAKYKASVNGSRRSRLSAGYPAYRYSQSATAAQAYRQPDPKPVKVHVHADMLKVKFSDRAKGLPDRGRPETGGGLRGTITGFSRASRKRMIEFMASVRYTGSMLFVTMTFDDGTAVNSDDWMLSCFEAFRKRFERAYPGWRALWRKEWQDRKSGDLTGTFVPHYHLIIMTGVHYEKSEHDAVSDTFKTWGQDAWQEITASTDPNHILYGFHVTPVRNRKHAYAYVGKYVGKTEAHNLHGGRAWGRIGTFDCTVSETFSLASDEYVVFRRLVKKWLKTRAGAAQKTMDAAGLKKHARKVARARAYARCFSRQSAQKGCSIFGLGDTCMDGRPQDIFAGYWQFIAEAKRQAADSRARESGHGN